MKMFENIGKIYNILIFKCNFFLWNRNKYNLKLLFSLVDIIRFTYEYELRDKFSLCLLIGLIVFIYRVESESIIYSYFYSYI